MYGGEEGGGGHTSAIAALSTSSKLSMSLCLKVLILAREVRAPLTMDEWLSESEMIRPPLPTRHGIRVELVAKPIPTTIAAGLPTKSATCLSSST